MRSRDFTYRKSYECTDATSEHYGEETDYDIKFTFTPGCRGYCEPHGQQIDPDEPATVEIFDVQTVIGTVIDWEKWSEGEIEELENECMEYACDYINGEYEDAMERKADQRRERDND
jgi:hypothetical protein